MKYIVNYARENKVFPAALEDAMLRGEIGRRIDRFIYERVSGEFARKEIIREAEECFSEQYDDEFKWGMWRSEFWGKLMLSAVRVCRLKNDEELKQFLRESAYRVIGLQREDGYLGTYKNSDNLLTADPADTIRDAGWPCVYNWSVWGTKYTLWAMIECAQLTDDAHILDAADALATNLLDRLEKNGVRIKDCGIMDGMPPCSVMKPLLVLYRLTGNERYYRFAQNIAADWERADNERPNLIANALSGKAPTDWYEITDAYDTWCAKAYEMMSCFDGLCELYRISGNEHILDAVKAQYALLKKYESNILGGVGYCEHFSNAPKYPDGATEVCDVIHWMRLCYELFCLTGEAMYMESFETAFVNAFMAGLYEDGKNGAFFVRSSGRHWDADPQVETRYQHCCLNNVPRGFCNAAEAVFMRSAEAIYVNSYIPARAVFGALSLKTGNGYLDNGSVALTVYGASADQKLMLRIPEWSKETLIRMNDDEFSAKAGEYACVTLPEGDTIIRLFFDMTPRILDFTGEFVDLPATDYHVHRWVDERNGLCDRSCMVKHPMSTLRRGALIYARSKRVGCTEEDMFSGKTVCGQDYACTASVIRHSNLLSCCRVTLTKGEEKIEYVMCDYASAANRVLDDARYFNMFI